MSDKKPRALRYLKRYARYRLYAPETRTSLAANDLQCLFRTGVRISLRDMLIGQDVTYEILPETLH